MEELNLFIWIILTMLGGFVHGLAISYDMCLIMIILNPICILGYIILLICFIHLYLINKYWNYYIKIMKIKI